MVRMFDKIEFSCCILDRNTICLQRYYFITAGLSNYLGFGFNLVVMKAFLDQTLFCA